MKVRNMTNGNGCVVPNQFIIETEENGNDLAVLGLPYDENTLYQVEYFQSYETIIAKKIYCGRLDIILDRDCWNYSKTTGKYRNQFLGETKRETEKKIKSGEYILTDLN